MANTNRLNDTSFDSFFQQTILDNNGIAVTDINAGLRNLFGTFNENSDKIEERQRYLVSEFEEGFPDLIALHAITGSQDYWWWITMLNRLEDPMIDFKANWIYSINSQFQISDLIDKSNENGSTAANERYGELVELN